MKQMCNLLVVDDDIQQVYVLESLHQSLDPSHRYFYVSDGNAALDFLYHRPPYEKTLPPDLILLDLNLPGMPGHDVLRAVKADPKLRPIPIIILSDSTSTADVQACYSEHANAYIVKPHDLDGHLRVVRAIESFWMNAASLAQH
jgi:chemotaxis family two-component system response regulator Rcp1